MTFLNDLWKQFKTTDIRGSKEKQSAEDSLAEREKLLTTYQEIETEAAQRKTTLNNLEILRDLVNEPKEEMLGLRFTKIKEHLGSPESYETVRQERWHEGINCPNCRSQQIKRVAHRSTESPNKHRYRCLNCDLEFADDSGTAVGTGVPPLNVWMQCWYLMGCTDSLNYIAARLNLEVGVVENMVKELKRIFNAQKPLTNLLKFEEWEKKSEDLRKKLSDDLIKQYELLDANIATSPKDTSEFRRQQNLRRTLNANTAPPPSTGTPKSRR